MLNDEGTVKEILGLQRKNGRIDHSSSGNDDRVISWLLCSWLLIHGRNLNYYGISNPLSRAMDYRSKLMLDGGDTNLAAKLADKERQEKLKEEIDSYLLLLKSVKDEFLSNQYEAKLRRLESMYSGSGFGALTVSDLIHQAKSEKFRKRVNRALAKE